MGVGMGISKLLVAFPTTEILLKIKSTEKHNMLKISSPLNKRSKVDPPGTPKMRTDAEMMSLLLNFFENLKIWKERCWSGILQGWDSPGSRVLWLIGGRWGGGWIFSGAGFLRIFL